MSAICPVTYFAEQVLQRRLDECLDDTEAKKDVATTEGLLRSAKAKRASRELIKGLKEFCGKAMVAWAHARGVQFRLIQPGKPNQNAYVESFNGRLRDE